MSLSVNEGFVTKTLEPQGVLGSECTWWKFVQIRRNSGSVFLFLVTEPRQWLYFLEHSRFRTVSIPEGLGFRVCQCERLKTSLRIAGCKVKQTNKRRVF